ncbi:MAG: hypothetical protein C4325_01705 [Blastocatellia bacterium]
MAEFRTTRGKYGLILAIFVGGYISIMAQDVRPPRPTPSPNAPEIISRADDFVEETGTERRQDLPQKSVNITTQSSRRRGDIVKSDPRSAEIAARESVALNLDILTRAEQRTDSLRKQLFEMMEKEFSIRSRLEAIEYDLRPEVIDRQLATVGSLRPEELRAQRRRSLELERQNLNLLLSEVTKAKASLENNLSRSEALVERLRARLEKEIDRSLEEPEDNEQQRRQP